MTAPLEDFAYCGHERISSGAVDGVLSWLPPELVPDHFSPLCAGCRDRLTDLQSVYALGVAASELQLATLTATVARLEQERAEYEKRPWPGCRMLSQGDACQCSLCKSEAALTEAQARIATLERERDEKMDKWEQLLEQMNESRSPDGDGLPMIKGLGDGTPHDARETLNKQQGGYRNPGDEDARRDPVIKSASPLKPAAGSEPADSHHLETQLAEAQAQIAALRQEIATAREACPVVRRQDYFDASLLTLVNQEVGQLFQMQSRAETAEAQIAALREKLEHMHDIRNGSPNAFYAAFDRLWKLLPDPHAPTGGQR